MKLKIYAALWICLFVVMSCSNDDDSNNDNEQIAEELLVNFSPWTFSNYTLINIIDAGSSNATANDIETQFSDDFAGLTLAFTSNGTGTAMAPVSESNFFALDSGMSWILTDSNQLKLVIEEYPSGEFLIEIEVIFENIQVSESLLIMEQESSYYDADADFDVEVYGQYNFQ